MQAWSSRPMMRFPQFARPYLRCRLSTPPPNSWCRSARIPERQASTSAASLPTTRHIGHANTYVAFDLLHRVWRDRGLEVNYVQNVTDIDDPLLERAADIGIEWAALAEQQTQLFREDMAALNVLPPQHYVGAVESMPLIVDLIEELRRRQAVYPWTTASSRTCTSHRGVTRSSVHSPTFLRRGYCDLCRARR